MTDTIAAMTDTSTAMTDTSTAMADTSTADDTSTAITDTSTAMADTSTATATSSTVTGSIYHQAFRRSLDDMEGFWGEAAREITWYRQPEKILDASSPPFYRWFPDGQMNTCYNALDRHVENGRADQVALIYDSPVTGTKESYTYAELTDQVARFAGALVALGVAKGDRVLIYMPMVPEAVVAMLACARIGAVHSVVFGGFAAPELGARIRDALPKVIVSASCGIEVSRLIEYKPLLDRAIALSGHIPQHTVIVQRPQAVATLGPTDMDWETAMLSGPVECVPLAATDPLYILYTSGTTGRPKGIVRDNGGHAVALRWSMANIYDVHPGEVYWAASDVGWVVGHSYIVYAPLITGCTTVLYEGKPVGTPNAGAFWRVIAEHGVNVLFTAPTSIRSIKKEDPKGLFASNADLSSLKYLFLAGERLDPDTYLWASELLGIPVIDHWWQTESGWPMAANHMGLDPLPVKPGSPTVPVAGYDIAVVNALGNPVETGTDGNIVVKLPLPPGTLPTLWHNDQGYIDAYLSRFTGNAPTTPEFRSYVAKHDSHSSQSGGYYCTGDTGHFDDDGYIHIMGRTDDVINVAGYRLTTGAMEEVISNHPDVAECAVIGVKDPVTGQAPRAFVVLKTGSTIDPNLLAAQLTLWVREYIGPVAVLTAVDVVAALPKTRSGKILRKTMRGIADGHDEPVPSTIDDPAVLDRLRPLLTGVGA